MMYCMTTPFTSHFYAIILIIAFTLSEVYTGINFLTFKVTS